MDPLVPLLAVFHTIGAVIGTYFTTFAEIYYTRATADGILDKHERKYLQHIYRGLKWGMGLILVSGVALLVIEYLTIDSVSTVLAGPFWMIELLTLFILLMGWSLSRRQVRWWFASSSLLSAWWAILLVDLGFFNGFTFSALFFLYVVFLFVLAGALGLLRLYVWKPRPINSNES